MRGKLSGRLQRTRLETSVAELLSNQRASPEEFEERIARANTIFNEINLAQEEIEKLLSDEASVENESVQRSTIEERYYSLCAKCNAAIKRLRNENNIDNERVSSPPVNQNIANVVDSLAFNQTQLTNIIQTLTNQPSTGVQSANDSEIVSKIHLPTLQVPTFNGNYRDWPSFCDMFKSVIHANETLSPVQKFQYLKLSLQGEAESTLKHLCVSDVNYEVAFDLLTKKYDKEDLIVEAHLQTLNDFPSLKMHQRIIFVF